MATLSQVKWRSALASGRPHCLSRRVVFEQLEKGSRQRRRMGLRNQYPGFAVDDTLHYGSRTAGDNRRARGHCLNRRYTKALIPDRREREDIRVKIVIQQLRAWDRVVKYDFGGDRQQRFLTGTYMCRPPAAPKRAEL